MKSNLTLTKDLGKAKFPRKLPAPNHNNARLSIPRIKGEARQKHHKELNRWSVDHSSIAQSDGMHKTCFHCLLVGVHFSSAYEI